MRNFSKLSVVIVLLLSFSSCIEYKEVEITNIKHVKLLEFSKKGLIVESEIQIKNPNSFKLSIVDSDFDIFVKGSKLAKASIDNDIVLAKNSEEYHTVIMKSDYKDFADGALVKMLGLTMGSREIDFKVDGYITGKAFFIKKKVHVSHEEKVPLKLF